MKKITPIIFIIVWIVCVGTTNALEIPHANAIPFLGIEEATAEVKKAVFAVQIVGPNTAGSKKDKWMSLGSGFLVKGRRNTFLGVTCAHIVSAAEKAQKPLFMGLDTEKGYRRFECKVGYKDPNSDVAILLPQKGAEEEIKILNKFFPEKIFGGDDSLAEGRGVLIPGYPLSLGVIGNKNHPVVRFGIIAQYTGTNAFLIDGVASHGSSGSPVFALKLKERKLVGMITSHVTDRITLYNEKGQLAASFPYNAGLARAITMDVVVEGISKVKY